MSTDDIEKKVWVFFYDSYMNMALLQERDIVPESIDVAKLSGFDIVVGPEANVVARFDTSVFGVLTTATHAELKRLYEEPYFPEAVIVQLLDGSIQAALCYMAHSIKVQPANNAVLDCIVQGAKKYGFSQSYIKHLESYRAVNAFTTEIL